MCVCVKVLGDTAKERLSYLPEISFLKKDQNKKWIFFDSAGAEESRTSWCKLSNLLFSTYLLVQIIE